MSGVTLDDPERALALSYASAAARPALAALFALDAALGQVLRTTREPAIGEIRLAWWRERLEALDQGAAPAEPVLQALSAQVLPLGVRGSELAPLAEAWFALVGADSLDAVEMQRFAVARGGLLFALAARLVGAKDMPIEIAGQGWAFADLARDLSDPALRGEARELARQCFATMPRVRWSRAARPLGALVRLAIMDLALLPDRPIPVGAPPRVARLLWHRLTGR